MGTRIEFNRVARGHPFPTSVGLAVAWTSGGLAIAVVNGSFSTFASEWVRLQGTISLVIGVWLTIAAACYPLTTLVLNFGVEHRSSRALIVTRVIVIAGVTLVGSASLISLGFNGRGVSLWFLNTTCVIICALAAVATWHGIEIVIASRMAANTDLHVFVYSPAETKELRFLARHAATYAAILTLGYSFTLTATLLSRWTGDPVRVRTVVTFWPMLYVPFCMLLLIFPQVQFRKLIRREKERLMSVCQETIDNVLKKDDLTTDDVQRCNALADLFDKVAATPEYVLDVGIVTKAIWIVAANAITLLLPREHIVAAIRGYLSP